MYYILLHILLFVTGFLLFFFGLYLVRSNLKPVSHDRLSGILSRMTTSPWRGALFGTLITAAVQSSSAVMVVTVGLVDAGLLAFPQAVGIILGTNVGTCITVQLFSFSSNHLWIPFILCGSIIICLGRRNKGGAIFGFGCVFLGLTVITLASSPLVQSPHFLAAVSAAKDQPVKGVLIGALSTAVIQYSSIVIGVVIALSQHNTIPLEAALPFVLGSNLGTCITGLLVSIGASSGAKQVAAAHILLNLAGIIVFLPVLDHFAHLVALTADTPAIQIANAHTLFNLFSSLAILPFAGPFTKLVVMIVHDR